MEENVWGEKKEIHYNVQSLINVCVYLYMYVYIFIHHIVSRYLPASIYKLDACTK